MPPANEEKYITVRELNAYLVRIIAGMGAIVLVLVGATVWINAQINTRVSREEFAAHVIQQNRWQDRIEQSLMHRTPVSLDGQRQFQLVLVEIPDTDAERHDVRVREAMQILAREGD